MKESKEFKKLVYESDDLCFVDLCVDQDHAIATDNKGKLWGWGYNENYRIGFNEGIHQPNDENPGELALKFKNFENVNKKSIP